MRATAGAAAIVVALVVGMLLVPGAAAAATVSAPQPRVSGNQLVDAATGRPWQPHGVNFPSFEYACAQGWGYSRGQATAATARAIAAWNANVVRIPLNQDCWLGTNSAPAGGGRTAAGYRDAVAAFVGQLNAAGLAVILDLHSWKTDTTSNIVGQRAMPDAASLSFWTSVAGRFASNPSVIFDAFNEPYSRWNSATSSWAFALTWACWKGGGCMAPIEDDYTATLSGATYPVIGMDAIVAAIRAAGAGQPIILAGLDYSNDLRGWLANRPADAQLIAGFHNYRGQRCQNAGCWDAEIAPVAAVVPVISGEFGETDGTSSFMDAYTAWADSHAVGYLAWAWWVLNGSPTELALLAADDGTPLAPLGTAFRAHLLTLPLPSCDGPLAVPLIRTAAAQHPLSGAPTPAAALDLPPRLCFAEQQGLDVAPPAPDPGPPAEATPPRSAAPGAAPPDSAVPPLAAPRPTPSGSAPRAMPSSPPSVAPPLLALARPGKQKGCAALR